MPDDVDTILRTERLVLRRFRADEAPAVAQYKNDPDVARFGDWDLPYPVEDIAAKIDRYAHRRWPCPGSGLNVAIEWDGELIGDFGAGWDDAGTEAEVGYTLRTEYQGKGFASEVLAAVVDHLFSEGVERVTMSLDPDDVASLQALEKVGFRFEASSRVEIRGEWVDDVLHAITRKGRAARIADNTERDE